MTNEAEERYFRERDRELRKKYRKALEKAAREAQRRRELADELGTSDAVIIESVKSLGLDGDTVRVLDIFPVIAVAWADDSIQSGERVEIMRVLKERGISEESEAWHLVASLLETRPTDAFIAEVISILNAIHHNQGGVARSLVDLSHSVAKASAGMFGIGVALAPSEVKWIKRIANSMGEDAQARLEELLSEEE